MISKRYWNARRNWRETTTSTRRKLMLRGGYFLFGFIPLYVWDIPN